MTDTVGIIGTDGYAPILSPEKWTMWSMHEIYLGHEGLNKFIPRVSHYIIEPDTGNTYKVEYLNEVTYIPSLVPIVIKQTIDINEIISSTNDNFRVYYDKSISPYSLAVDGLVRIYSNTATHARIYRGNNIDANEVISKRYDNNGNLIGMDVPLTMVAFNSHDNYAIKSIPTCNTTAELLDGEPCSVVVFDSNGKVVSRVNCIVEETTYIAPAFAEQKFITEIFLKTPFIEVGEPEIINYPVNLPMDSFHPIGVVQYNDGSQVEYPVDGDKFRLYGIESFVSTIIGHNIPLVLSYRMDSNEAALTNVHTLAGRYVTRDFKLKVSNPNTSYNVKLYIYPVWVDRVNGYRLKAYLMNLDRNVLFDVTQLITLSTNSAPFNPLLYNIIQRVSFNIDLNNVSSIYNSFIYTQTIDIVLRGHADESTINNIWEVKTQIPTATGFYGTNIIAVRNNTSHNKITISNNLNTVEDFLASTYRKIDPLSNPITETQAPDPTHIEVRYNNESKIIPIGSFKDVITFTSNVTRFDTIDIVFLRNVLSNYLKLGVLSMIVR